MKRSIPAMLAKLLPPLLISAFAAALAATGPASGQSLLDDLLPQTGVCTCAVMEPPNDCAAALAEPRSIVAEQRGQVRAQCARDWRAGCEEEYGWQACASQEANLQMAAQCDEIAERWYTEVAAPQLSELSNQCNAANASWIQQCETVERPAQCSTCTDMGDEIAKLEADISEARAWLESMRNGGAVLTPDDEQEITQRIDEVDRWERDLEEKQQGFSMLQDSEFCPRA
jgi:hypothetical protein